MSNQIPTEWQMTFLGHPRKECLSRQLISQDSQSCFSAWKGMFTETAYLPRYSCLKDIIPGETQLQTCALPSLMAAIAASLSLHPVKGHSRLLPLADLSTSLRKEAAPHCVCQEAPSHLWPPDSCLFAFLHLFTLPGSALESAYLEEQPPQPNVPILSVPPSFCHENT